MLILHESTIRFLRLELFQKYKLHPISVEQNEKEKPNKSNFLAHRTEVRSLGSMNDWFYIQKDSEMLVSTATASKYTKEFSTNFFWKIYCNFTLFLQLQWCYSGVITCTNQTDINKAEGSIKYLITSFTKLNMRLLTSENISWCTSLSTTHTNRYFYTSCFTVMPFLQIVWISF